MRFWITVAFLLPTLLLAKPGSKRGAVYTATIFCDSVAGNDSNNGLTPATAKKTLAGVRAMSPGASAIIGLKRGSYWREELYGLTAGCSIIAYGTGNAPIIDSSDRATGFTATTGRTNVWEVTWARDTTAHACDGTCSIMLWEGDTQLAAAASLSACESTAGSFVESGGKVYYHPSDNNNPSGKAVFITKRPEGIYQYVGAGNSANGITIDGIRARNSWAHYGGISNGVGGVTKNCIVDGGGIHHMVLAPGTVQDVLYYNMSPTHTEGFTPLAVYMANGVGSNPVVTRLFVVGTAATRSIHGVLLSHTSNDPTTSYDTMTWDQCYVSYGSGFSGSATGAFTVSNSVVDNGAGGAVLGIGTPTLQRCLFRSCSGFASNGSILSDAGPTDTTNRTRTISNSVVYVADSASSGGPSYAARLTQRQGSITFTNCVLYLNTPNRSTIGIWAASNGASNQLSVTVNNCVIVSRGGGAYAFQFDDANVTYTGDHNVFVRTDAAPSALDFKWQGTPTFGLTAWRAATGQDAHSVYLSASQFATFFSGTVANGDFRINASNPVTDANGTVYTGQFPDAVALSTVGVQSYWNFNTRAVVNTAPIKWPVPPQTIAQANTYVANPTGWNFY